MMIWGIVKVDEQVMLITRSNYRKLSWKKISRLAPDTIKPKLELSAKGVYAIYALEDYLFHEQSLEKNDHIYRICLE